MTRPSPDIVLDASALLALVRNESGADAVRKRLPAATVSAVNLGEAACVLRRNGVPEAEARAALDPLVPNPVLFSGEQAWLTGELYQATRGVGLSFGDCACLALARSLGLPALTTDAAWKRADTGVPIIMVR